MLNIKTLLKITPKKLPDWAIGLIILLISWCFSLEWGSAVGNLLAYGLSNNPYTDVPILHLIMWIILLVWFIYSIIFFQAHYDRIDKINKNYKAYLENVEKSFKKKVDNLNEEYLKKLQEIQKEYLEENDNIRS